MLVGNWLDVNLRKLLPQLSIAQYNEFCAGELFKPHWASSVYLVSGDADLSAEAELEAVIEAGRGVYQDRRRINLAQEPHPYGIVFSDDSV